MTFKRGMSFCVVSKSRSVDVFDRCHCAEDGTSELVFSLTLSNAKSIPSTKSSIVGK